MMGAGIYMIAVRRPRAAGGSAGRSSASGSQWRRRRPLAPLCELFGWMFTEVGRQPWVVYGLQKTADGVSQIGRGSVSASLLRRCSTARSPSSRCGCSCTCPARAQAGARTGRTTTSATCSPPWRTEGACLIDQLLVPADRRAVARLSGPRRVRLRGRHAAARRRPHAESGAGLQTIGPVWDGNEVWLLVAGGATFAAFPEWYATMFSGFYLALLLILAGLIVRGMAIEYRNKKDDAALAARWDWAIVPAAPAGAAVGRRVREPGRRRPARRQPRVRRGPAGTCSTRKRCSAASRRCRCSPSTARTSSRCGPKATCVNAPTGSPTSVAVAPSPGQAPVWIARRPQVARALAVVVAAGAAAGAPSRCCRGARGEKDARSRSPGSRSSASS